MSALLKSAPKARPSSPPRQLHSSQQQSQQRTQAVESAFIVGINGLLLAVGIYTLYHLVPHQWAQHQKLQAIRAETAQTTSRIRQLKGEYKKSFSSRERRRIAEEQGYLTGEKRLQMNWKR